ERCPPRCVGLYASRHIQSERSVANTGFVECLAKRSYLANHQKTSAGIEIWLENIVCRMAQTLAERIEPLPAFAARNHERFNLTAQARRSLKVISGKWLFQPVNTDFLK